MLGKLRLWHPFPTGSFTYIDLPATKTDELSGEPKPPIASLLTSTSNAAAGLPRSFVLSKFMCRRTLRAIAYMSMYAQHLNAAANEVLQYFASHKTDLQEREDIWIQLADAMENAATISDTIDAENAIRSIARVIVDEFPLDVDFAPSFSIALSGVQKVDKNRRHQVRG